LLDDDRTRADLTACDEISNFHFDDVASTKLAIGREIEHRAVAQSLLLIQPKSDCPHLLGLQGAFGSNYSACIPRPPIL